MRIARWKMKEHMEIQKERIIRNGNEAMDDVVKLAKQLCPVGTVTRDGSYVDASISFTPKAGKNKGRSVSFETARFMGRRPGMLRDTIRRVTRNGNIRVYAGGTKKVYWQLYVERGTIKMRKRPFLRPAFNALKSGMKVKLRGF